MRARLLIAGSAVCGCAVLVTVAWWPSPQPAPLVDPPPSREEPARAPEVGRSEAAIPATHRNWAPRLYLQVAAGEEGPGPYRPGESPLTRPFDAADPEMQALMARAYAVGGCARPEQTCEPAARLFREGGDRLARYLIGQYERSLRDGYPSSRTYLNYIAYTQSETGLDYILNRVQETRSRTLEEYHEAVAALSKTGRWGAVDEAVRILDADEPPSIREQAVNTLWRVSIAQNELRPEILDRIERYRDGVPDRSMVVPARGAIWRLEQHFGDLGDPDPTPR